MSIEKGIASPDKKRMNWENFFQHERTRALVVVALEYGASPKTVAYLLKQQGIEVNYTALQSHINKAYGKTETFINAMKEKSIDQGAVENEVRNFLLRYDASRFWQRDPVARAFAVVLLQQKQESEEEISYSEIAAIVSEQLGAAITKNVMGNYANREGLESLITRLRTEPEVISEDTLSVANILANDALTVLRSANADRRAEWNKSAQVRALVIALLKKGFSVGSIERGITEYFIENAIEDTAFYMPKGALWQVQKNLPQGLSLTEYFQEGDDIAEADERTAQEIAETIAKKIEKERTKRYAALSRKMNAARWK